MKVIFIIFKIFFSTKKGAIMIYHSLLRNKKNPYKIKNKSKFSSMVIKGNTLNFVLNVKINIRANINAINL